MPTSSCSSPARVPGSCTCPVNFALKGDELSYLLEDSQSSVLVADNDLLPLVAEVQRAGRAASIRSVLPMFPGETDGPDAESVLSSALAGDASPVDVEVGDDDLAQLLYTSGTTSQPKGAMMTQAALVHQYLSCIIALDFTAADRPLIAMPLYHSAAMHVFAMPYLALGARIRLMQRPDVAEMLRLVEEERIGSLFLAPTVWVPLANHADLDTRDLSSLTKAQYGASIMPVTVLQRLRQRYPEHRFLQLLRPVRDGPARHGVASRGARRQAGILRPPDRVRGGAGGRRGRHRGRRGRAG